MSMSFPSAPDDLPLNPYEAPKVEIDHEPVSQEDDIVAVELIRRNHIKHEASIKGVGALVILGSISFMIFSLAILLRTMVRSNGPNDLGIVQELGYGFGVFLLGTSVFLFFVGRGLRRFQPWSRWAEAIVCVLNMITLNPITIVLSIYFLYLLLSSKGTMVFSREYKAIIEKTPHIQYKTSRLLIVLLVALVTIIVLGAVGGIFYSVRSRG